ncbi:unnamed protein product, partial [Musa banksii]
PKSFYFSSVSSLCFVLCSRFLPFFATTPRVEHRGTVTCSLLLSFLLFLSQPQLPQPPPLSLPQSQPLPPHYLPSSLLSQT